MRTSSLVWSRLVKAQSCFVNRWKFKNVCRGCIQMLRNQRGELCQLTSCCPSAPYLLFYALPCELELSSTNIVPLPAGTVLGCVNKGHWRDTVRQSRGGDFSVSCVIFLPSGCGCQQHVWHLMLLTVLLFIYVTQCFIGTSVGRFFWTSFSLTAPQLVASYIPAPNHGTSENFTGTSAHGFL